MPRKPFVLPPGGGRVYPMGRLQAVFKADGDETGGAASVSEWWLDARSEGPPVHDHPEDHVFYVVEGTLTHPAPQLDPQASQPRLCSTTRSGAKDASRVANPEGQTHSAR